MWKIGNVSLENRIIAAPLAGISNPVYRLICRRHGAALTVSEMISDKALHYQNQRTFDMCAINPLEHPVALQLFGGSADTMAEAADYLSTHTSCDLIDINMGCPVTKVIKAHAGSDLMRDPERAEEIVRAVVSHTDRPVTVKIRAGWDFQHINCAEFAKRMENCGISAIAVHGRTRNQLYAGNSDNRYIRMVKDAVSVPVIGNGDIRSVEDAERMREETGCDAVMIGRGLLGNPFLLDEILAHDEGRSYTAPDLPKRIDACLSYGTELCAYEGEETGIRMMRGMAGWFMRGMPESSFYKNRLASINTLDELFSILNEYRDEVLHAN